MATGKADPMKLFMDKKLRITGDIMASQKLEFLKKIDPKAAKRPWPRRRAPRRLPRGRCCCDDGCSAKADAQAGKIFAALSARLLLTNPGASLGRWCSSTSMASRCGSSMAQPDGARRSRCRGQDRAVAQR